MSYIYVSVGKSVYLGLIGDKNGEIMVCGVSEDSLWV